MSPPPPVMAHCAGCLDVPQCGARCLASVGYCFRCYQLVTPRASLLHARDQPATQRAHKPGIASQISLAPREEIGYE